MKKNLLIIVFGVMTLISACGGGGGSAGAPAPVQTNTAALKLSIAGTLPAGTSVAGLDVVVTLPSGVTVKSTTAPVTDSGVVVASGLAGASTQVVSAYTPAAGTTAATVRVLLADVNGFAAGEFATVNCDIAPGSAPKAADFTVQTNEVKDLNGAAIAGMTAQVATTIE